MLEKGIRVRSPPCEEEGAAETMYDEPIVTPIPSLLCLRGGDREFVSEV